MFETNFIRFHLFRNQHKECFGCFETTNVGFILITSMYMYIIHSYDNNPQYGMYIIYML